MTLAPRGYVDLPAHAGPGGFDHAAVHRASGTLYVAHTANDAVDVVDGRRSRYVHSIPGLKGVAGALVSDERDLVFTSNRGEDSVSIFPVGREAMAVKVKVGVRPNGLAFDPSRGLLLAANVGDPDRKESPTVSLVDVGKAALVANLPVPGRTRWSVFDAASDAFYVNIRDPPRIVVIDARDPTRVTRSIEVPAAGPHGLDVDADGRRLFCASDAAKLVALDLVSGRVLAECRLSGAPDVAFYNAARRRLYVAVGDPGTIDVIDTDAMDRVGSCATEAGAHTIGFDAATNRVYAFLPGTHRAAVYEDVEEGA